MHARIMDNTIWVKSETCRWLLVHTETTFTVVFMVYIVILVASLSIYIILLNGILRAFLMDFTAPSSPHSVYRIKQDGCQLQKMMVWVEKRCFSLQCPADGCCRLIPVTTSVWLELKNPVIKHTTDGTFPIFRSILNKQPTTYVECAGAFSNVTGNGEKRKNSLPQT